MLWAFDDQGGVTLDLGLAEFLLLGPSVSHAGLFLPAEEVRRSTGLDPAELDRVTWPLLKARETHFERFGGGRPTDIPWEEAETSPVPIDWELPRAGQVVLRTDAAGLRVFEAAVTALLPLFHDKYLDTILGVEEQDLRDLGDSLAQARKEHTARFGA